MKRMSLLALLLLPGLAGAQSQGEVAFTRVCASCHQAGAPAAKQAHKKNAATPATAKKPGPHLGELLKSRTGEQLREWIRAPHKANPKTACDTRLLKPHELDDVVSYLALSKQPPPLPRDELLRQQLEKQLAVRRAKRSRPADQTIETRKNPQGKK